MQPQNTLFPAARRQWLAVDGFVTDRFLVNYRAPATELARLVPAPFTLDCYGGHGFLSVCVLEVRSMGIRALPRALRFHNLEVLYRLGVRFGDRPSFVSLRSDTSSRALALLGGCFSHYRLRAARIRLSRGRGRFALQAQTRNGSADAHFDVDPSRTRRTSPTSAFSDAAEADRRLLGMAFSVDPGRRGRVLLQPIEHSPWRARFVEPRALYFEFLDRLSRDYAIPLEYDSTLAMRGIHQTWHAARWVARAAAGSGAAEPTTALELAA
ncbi:MAG TPA: DUF2071 domain-containing protein [Polyangiaceae bacterium]